MSAEGVLKFIAVVELHFPRPKFNEDETMEGAWVASMTRTLGGYADDVLNEAAQRILRDRSPKRDGRFFPAPSECSEVCVSVAKTLQAQKTPLLAYAKQDLPYSARCDLARDLMQSPLGKRARKEGWAESMFYFCVWNGKAPSGHEIDECKSKANEFANVRERCARGEYELGGAWARYAEGMVRKARELMEKPA